MTITLRTLHARFMWFDQVILIMIGPCAHFLYAVAHIALENPENCAFAVLASSYVNFLPSGHTV